MATPLYPTFEKRVNDAIDQLITKQVIPWSFMTAGPPFRVNRFDGRPIAYQGVRFEGSPRVVFWGRYIEPFLEDLCISEISAAVSMAKERGVDGRLLFSELQGLLSSGVLRVYGHMADVDRRLRGNGYPESVPLRAVEGEVQRMNRFLDERINAEMKMWRSNPMSESDIKRSYLAVPVEEAKRKIQVQVEKARLILDWLNGKRAESELPIERVFEKAQIDQEKWAKYSIDLLKSLFSDDLAAREFGSYWVNYSLHGDQIEELEACLRQRIACLQSIIERLPLFQMATTGLPSAQPSADESVVSKDVFVVHGHDDAAKHEVARFLEKLDLNPIILHELPDEGKTIIEKFEANSNVGFAVVLLTPDDIGYPKDTTDSSKPRARQNVILELGFFLGKLGRHKVCAMKKDDVELPTDYSGVLYKPLDGRGAWKIELAKEIKQAGIPVDLNRAL